MTTTDDRARGAWPVTDEILELMARSHDAEHSAQMGEPSPWLNHIAGADPDFHDDRVAAMREAVRTLLNCGLAIIDTSTHVAVPREPDEAMVERVGQAIFLCGLDITYREQARVAIAAMTQGGDDGKDV